MKMPLPEPVAAPVQSGADAESGSGPVSLRPCCPSCGSVDRKALPWGADRWTLVECLSCEMVYMPETPRLEAFAAQYEWSATYAAEAQARKKRAPIIARIDAATRWRTRLIPQTNPMDFVRGRLTRGSILDVGCGNGGYLATHAAGYELHGIDISPKLTADAARVFEPTGGRVVCASAAEGLNRFAEHSIDAAILRSYLEHEPEPLPVLRRLRDVLKPGGFAVVKTPNYDSVNRLLAGRRWCGFRFPDHVNQFTPKTLSELAQRAGFTVEWRWRDRLPTDDNMWCVLS